MTTRISLALQGGGTHGAFTWGVIDRLLEEKDMEIAAISGTSAGALNGAALKSGLVHGGAACARERLTTLWNEVLRIGEFQDLGPWFQFFRPMAQFWKKTIEASLPFDPGGLASQVYSPYSWGSSWENPLLPVIKTLEFERICAKASPQLFVGATNVRSGKVKIFSGFDVTIESILASACIPTIFQAVEIDGEAYWDGGFTGNPALWPLYHVEFPDDIIIIQVNPLNRQEIPRTPREIENRVNEISFNASLMSELRAIAFVRRLISEGRLPQGLMKNVRVHMISDDTLMTELTAETKLEPSASLIMRLFDAGRRAGDNFIDAHGEHLGKVPSVELRDIFG